MSLFDIRTVFAPKRQRLTALALLLWTAACSPDESTCPPVATAGAAAEVGDPTLGGLAEQTDLAGDFELLDPTADPVPSLADVVPTLSDLPVPVTRLTMRYVENFAVSDKGRDTFTDRYRRSFKYREHIERKLRDQEIPEDLVWLVAIESGFKPQAVSPVGAAGLFQFMPETAERFGLTVTEEHDERRSVTKSTDAAIAYLTIMFEQLGSWDLAIAAYNCGEGRVLEAVTRARQILGRTEDEPVAFHELAERGLLPRETMHFVPMIHAFAIVAHNAELLTLDDLDPPLALHFTEIAVPAGTRLGLIAKAADVSVSTLQEYNPDFLLDRVPGAKGDQLVQIPANVLEQTLAALPALIAREVEKPSVALPVTSALPDGEPKPDQPKTKKRKKKSAGGAKVALEASTVREGAYVLPSGIYVELSEETAGSVLEVGARLDLLDPTNNRKPVGSSFTVAGHKVKGGDVAQAVAATKKDLQALVFGDAGQKLRDHVTVRRRGFFAKATGSESFGALSDRMFPEGHPLHGGLLIGTSERFDDFFLEPEPAWAFGVTMIVKGSGPTDELAVVLEEGMDRLYVPSKAGTLAGSSRATVGDAASELLVGWASPALSSTDETAAHLAFLLACHEQVGRAHVALRRGNSIAAGVSCGLETTPYGNVGWMFAVPLAPATPADAEKAIDAALAGLMSGGPTDAELGKAKTQLRLELTREREMAKMRGLPKSRVIANGERILSKMSEVDTVDIATIAKTLFSKEHRVVVVGGRKIASAPR